MALQPMIPLQGLVPQFQYPDFLRSELLGQQIANERTQERMRQFQLSELLRTAQEREQFMQPGGLGSQFLSLYGGQASPAAAAPRPAAAPISRLNPQVAAGPIQQTPLDQPLPPQTAAPVAPVTSP